MVGPDRMENLVRVVRLGTGGEKVNERNIE